jgi:NitT/TauT family transport system ATP-binding protein
MTQTKEPMLALEAVTKRFESKRGRVDAVVDVSFTVGQGEFVSILGPSGCGKSTLLRLMAGVAPVSSGEIRVAGKSVSGPVRGLGMVFQTPVLLEWRDVMGNVLLPLEIMHNLNAQTRRRASDLIEMVGLAEFKGRLPWELSGGMQQRVAICRALVINPPVLLMDEPFGALDALTRDEMAIELLRIWGETKKTIVFVTHSIEEAVLLSDRVVVMTPRPGNVDRIVDIDLPRPRTTETRYEERFGEYSHELRRLIFSRRGLVMNGEGPTPGALSDAALAGDQDPRSPSV